ncbi:uncharacterized protein LOC143914709 [Arctopsyche grandis]|uniref:uncharacterized protein LOC143914709 n=1 Tax=Arctopsyche grandis TaxID=121162 RepID=UPI00406D6A0F
MALSSDVTSIESKETGGKRRRSPCRRVSRTSGRSEMSTFLATIISSSVKKSHIWTSDTSSRVSILLRMNARTSLITTLQAQIVAISVERYEPLIKFNVPIYLHNVLSPVGSRRSYKN